MNYLDFACPNCKYFPLEKENTALNCPKCRNSYPIQQSVPLLLPKDVLTSNIDGKNISLHDVQNIYDRAYKHDGIMGTELDQHYDQTTKNILLGFSQPLTSKRLLDLGTGNGSLWNYVSKDVIGYAVDPSIVGVVKTHESYPELTVAVSVGENLPFPDNFFDVVVSADTIEHTFSPKGTLMEIHRVLKPNGSFCVSLPTPRSLQIWGKNQIKQRGFHPTFFLQLGWVLLKRFFIFGKATFQPIDRDMTDHEWKTLIEETNFQVRQILKWPEDPQIPMVYLFHAEKITNQ